MKLRITGLSLALAFTAQHTHAEDRVLVKINDSEITQQQLMMFAGEHAAHMNQEEAARLLHNMISHELLYQAAIKNKIDELPNVKAALDAQRRNLLAQAVVQDMLVKTPITEEQLRAIYTAEVGSEQHTEYETRHILLDTEQDAKAAIARLNKGDDFASVAKEMSSDFSASEGGLMGWLSLGNMPPAYGETVRHLKDGEYNKQPVQSEYGWHVIKREHSKQVEPPSYDMLRDSLMASAQQQLVTEYLQELQQGAKIEYAK